LKLGSGGAAFLDRKFLLRQTGGLFLFPNAAVAGTILHLSQVRIHFIALRADQALAQLVEGVRATRYQTSHAGAAQ
jgi:hypothetical protein